MSAALLNFDTVLAQGDVVVITPRDIRGEAPEDLGEIRADALYPLEVFLRISGISRTRLHHARQQGIELKCINVGRRKFVRGSNGIDFIERLADAA